jgi:hypothetical protein
LLPRRLHGAMNAGGSSFLFSRDFSSEQKASFARG